MSAKLDTKVKAGEWQVRDKNARLRDPKAPTKELPRVHEPIPGFRYELYSSRFTAMPQSHAVKFLRDASFEVLNEHGQSVASLPEGAVDRAGMERPVLQPGEVVANLAELKKEALLARAGQIPGGERFNAKSAVEEIVAFLIASEDERQKMLEARANRRAPGGGDVDDMSPDEVAELVPAPPEMGGQAESFE